MLSGYYWHGNFRELQNVVKRAVLLCTGDTIEQEHLPAELIFPEAQSTKGANPVLINPEESNLKDAASSAQRAIIIDALKKAGFNKSKAAKALKIDRKTLYNKLKAYDISI